MRTNIDMNCQNKQAKNLYQGKEQTHTLTEGLQKSCNRACVAKCI